MLHGSCNGCCTFLGNGAWEQDKERSASEDRCMCKRKTHNNCCRDAQDCRSCCEKKGKHECEKNCIEHRFNFKLEMDTQESLENGSCVCKIIWLDDNIDG